MSEVPPWDKVDEVRRFIEAEIKADMAEQRAMFEGMEADAGMGTENYSPIPDAIYDARYAGDWEPLARLLLIPELRARLSEETWELVAAKLRTAKGSRGARKTRDPVEAVGQARTIMSKLEERYPEQTDINITGRTRTILSKQADVEELTINDWVEEVWGGWKKVRSQSRR